MKEELSKNDEVVFIQQNKRVMAGGGNVENESHCAVHPASVIAWLLLALAGLCLWMLRLLGVFSIWD